MALIKHQTNLGGGAGGLGLFVPRIHRRHTKAALHNLHSVNTKAAKQRRPREQGVVGEEEEGG